MKDEFLRKLKTLSGSVENIDCKNKPNPFRYLDDSFDDLNVFEEFLSKLINEGLIDYRPVSQIHRGHPVIKDIFDLRITGVGETYISGQKK